jgi:hypothetical protein
MTGHAKDEPLNRLRGLLRGSKAGSARRIRPAQCALRDAMVATADGGASQDLLEWAYTPARIPWLERSEYKYRLGSHQVILATCGVGGHHEAAVGHAEAEFVLVVEGPLLVFGSRFGAARAWSWAAPYNWHFAPPAERVVPAAVPLTPETYSRLWSTLWITLVATATGWALIRRAVALRPEFTHALHGVLREQALRPFGVEAADWALDGLRYQEGPLSLRARVRTKCAAISDRGGRWASTRAGRDNAAEGNPMRNTDGPRIRQLDHHHRRVLDAHPPYSSVSPPLPGGAGERPVARGRGEPPDQSTDQRPRFRPRPRA